eukprot:Rhum_TRINITY_DN8975_c0_g1::Rhum_TRINITY_DN8975_c0_g1_i1::g.30882::m.30882
MGDLSPPAAAGRSAASSLLPSSLRYTPHKLAKEQLLHHTRFLMLLVGWLDVFGQTCEAYEHPMGLYGAGKTREDHLVVCWRTVRLAASCAARKCVEVAVAAALTGDSLPPPVAQLLPCPGPEVSFHYASGDRLSGTCLEGWGKWLRLPSTDAIWRYEPPVSPQEAAYVEELHPVRVALCRACVPAVVGTAEATAGGVWQRWKEGGRTVGGFVERLFSWSSARAVGLACLARLSCLLGYALCVQGPYLVGFSTTGSCAVGIPLFQSLRKVWLGLVSRAVAHLIGCRPFDLADPEAVC